MRLVSCRTTEGELHPDGGLFLAVRDLATDSVRETQTRRIQCLRWLPDDRELIAVVGDQRGLSVVTFAADDPMQVSESTLPVEPTARGISISPDVDHVSFCDFPSGGDSPDDDRYSAYIYSLAEGRMIQIGPQCLDTRPVWSPTGRRLAYRGLRDAEDDSQRMVAIFDPKTGETAEIAVADSDDLSGDITGPDPAWSPDGRLLAFVSYEQGGSAIYVTDVSSGAHERVLQTNGIVHSLGFVSLPHSGRRA
jgi:Tol biopolymer transport system component